MNESQEAILCPLSLGLQPQSVYQRVVVAVVVNDKDGDRLAVWVYSTDADFTPPDLGLRQLARAFDVADGIIDLLTLDT